jgi:methionine synthase II (cobalamin-independent)
MTEIKSPGPEMFRLYLPDAVAFMVMNVKPAECFGKIKHVGSANLEPFNFLKSLVPPEEVKNLKVALPAPNWYHLRYKEGLAYPKEVYSSDQEYFDDIAIAYQTELQILYDAGLRNVQIDDPNLACMLSITCFFAVDANIRQTSAPRACSKAGKPIR